MVECVIRSVLHGGPIELFLIPASAPQLVYIGCGMYCPVYGMVHIKESLLLIRSNRSSGLMPYNRE